MNTLLLCLARVDRQSQDWLNTVRRDGFTEQAHYKAQRLSVSIGRLDSMATNGPKTRKKIMEAHMKLHHVLEQVEGIRETVRVRAS
jgi:hypothetical protein